MTSRFHRSLAALVISGAAVALGVDTATAQDRSPVKELALAQAARGVHGASKSASGLAYEFFIPAAFDAKAGANLVFILHGSNLSRTWGFANHPAGTFCADAVVVCPDGTTSNGSGGFNFLQGETDLKRLHELHDEVRAKLKIIDTFLYGHSQGAFFAMLYAGAYAKDVRGIVAQAGGMWIGTATSKEHHHQAIAIMHGTADPVVPYSNSLGALKPYRAAAYPLLHMRALEGWNHWPDSVQAAQELAWCEGMTASTAPRLVAAFDRLAAIKPESSDPAALYAVAKRLVTFPSPTSTVWGGQTLFSAAIFDFGSKR